MYKTKIITICWVSERTPILKYEIRDLFLVYAQFQAITKKSTGSAIICNLHSTLVPNTEVMVVRVIMSQSSKKMPLA